jgi:endo-1,4-beta-xylanase
LIAPEAQDGALSRRAVLAGLAAAPLVAAAPAIGTAALQDVAGTAGMMFGAAVRASTLADAAFRAAVVRECGSITPELELKWAWLEPKQGQLDFYDADQIAGFAAATGKAMHGHALLWHRSIAGWAAQALADKPDWSIVRRFLASVIPRYGTVARTWDVVNEPIDPGHRMDGLRPSPFLQAFGPDYIRRALEDARLFAPHATLFINDYGLDYDLPWQRDKRYLLLKLLEGLKHAGAPIQGIGLQAHLELAHQAAFNERVLADFLNELGGLGLQVRISELDVKEADRSLPLAERDRRVAEATGRYLDVALDNRAVGSVTCWGLSDRHSWLNPPGGAINRGLPLDPLFAPTPMHAAIAAAFARRKRVNP